MIIHGLILDYFLLFYFAFSRFFIMASNNTPETAAVIEQSTNTTAPIHEVTDVPRTVQSTPVGMLGYFYFFFPKNFFFIFNR